MKPYFLVCALSLPLSMSAQSLSDGIFMPKKSICVGVEARQAQFSKYWEGSTHRSNANIGTMTMQMSGAMAIYGITDRFNVEMSLPYVKTQASGGTMSGMQGFQDINLGFKYKLLSRKDLSLIAITGATLPSNNYVAAYPLAIGTQSKTIYMGLTGHYLTEKGWTATVQGLYHGRANITIDATNYYTDRNIFSNQVQMPDVVTGLCRVGYYTYRVGVEALLSQRWTLGGFDIRRHDMPFPSNRIQITQIGLLGHYRVPSLKDLEILGQVGYVVAGRNTGQSLMFSLGLAKAFDFNKK